MTRTKTLIFLLDAVRPRAIGKKTTPFMYELKNKKTYMPLLSLLGYSSGIHPSIWTATWQEKHGKFLVYEYNPKNSKFKWFKMFRFMPSKLRQYLFACFKIPYYYMPGFRKYFPKWYFERFLELPSTIHPDLAGYFATDKSEFKGHNLLGDIEKRYSMKYIGDHLNGFFNNEAPVEDWELSSKDIDFFFTYDTDGFGHSFGAGSKQMKELLRKIDTSIARLYNEALSKYDKVNLFIFSDHGMCDVKYFCDVQKYLDKFKYKCPKDFLAFFDASMVRFWTDNKEVKNELTKLMKKIPEITIIDDDLKEKYHVDFKNRRFGDILCTVKPETRIFPDYFAPVKAAIKGLHGYEPEFKDSLGIFITNAYIGKHMEIRIVDILPTIMGVLGINVPKNIDGKDIAKK